MARAISTGCFASTILKSQSLSAMAVPAFDRSRPIVAPVPTSSAIRSAISVAQDRLRSAMSGPAATKLAVVESRTSSTVSNPLPKCRHLVNSPLQGQYHSRRETPAKKELEFRCSGKHKIYAFRSVEFRQKCRVSCFLMLSTIA